MGWQDAPVVEEGGGWQSAPVVEQTGTSGTARTPPYEAALKKIRETQFPNMSDEQWADYSSKAFPPSNFRDIAQGVQTFGFGDEISSGLGALGSQVKNWLGDQNSPDFGTAFKDYMELEKAREGLGRQKLGALAPVADILGGVSSFGPGRAASGAVAGITAANLPMQAVTGGVTGSAGGALYGFGATDGDANARLEGAKTGGIVGGLTGVAAPLLFAGVGKALGAVTGRSTRAAAQVARALHREGIDTPAELTGRLSALGNEGMVADLGPNLTRQASTLASMPGEAQAIVRGSLSARAAGSNQRIRDALDNELGAAPIPSLEQESIRRAQQALSPLYEQALQGAANANVLPIARHIYATAQVLRGEAQSYVQQLVRMFSDNRGSITDPRILLNIRHAIDGFLEKDVSNQTRGVLTNIRQQVDAELTRAVPGIKQIDAQFEDLANQSAALDRGQQVLSDGPEAPVPNDFNAEFAGATPGVQMRLSQGGRALLERIVGTNANDLAALRRLIKGEGDWNRDRLVTLFGQQRADAILRVIENEGTMARTNAVVQQGPETAARLAGQQELGEVNVKIPTSATITGMSANLGSRVLNSLLNSRNSEVNRAIAELLTSPQVLNTPQGRALLRALPQRLRQSLGLPVGLSASAVALPRTPYPVTPLPSH